MKIANLIVEGVLYNCSARIEVDDKGKLVTKGNVTEQGLIQFLLVNGVDAAHIIRKKEGNVLQTIPFNSKRKRACTAIDHPDDRNKIRVFSKGAPEILIKYCKYYFDDQGQVKELNDSIKNHLMHNVVTD